MTPETERVVWVGCGMRDDSGGLHLGEREVQGRDRWGCVRTKTPETSGGHQNVGVDPTPVAGSTRREIRRV